MNKLFTVLLIIVWLGCLSGLAQNSKYVLSSGEKCIVLLRVEFLASRKVGTVDVISSSCSDPTNKEQAVNAARQIRFEPKIVDGKAVTVVKQIEYTFEKFDEWPSVPTDPKAEAVVSKAITALGGQKYLDVKTTVGKGQFTQMLDGRASSFQRFVDIIVFPDKERTEFKGGGTHTVQVNTGDTGWIYDDENEVIKVQSDKQVASFKNGMRVSLDNVLRGYWRGQAELGYAGRRAASLGKRNDVIKLTYKDGFTVEFEFSADDATPQKALYKRKSAEGDDIPEEDRYAQFIESAGLRHPNIIDHFIDGVHTSRINYETIEYNRQIPDSAFAKPTTPKEAKKGVKY